MAKQTTIKVLAKDYIAFQTLAPTEGVKVLEGTQVGDTVIASVKYRDPGYLFYLGYNLCKAMMQGTAPTLDGHIKKDKDNKSKK